MSEQVVAITVTDEQQQWLADYLREGDKGVAGYYDPGDAILAAVWGALPVSNESDDR